MRDVTYSMSMSLDGYIVGPDGTFDWSVPDPEVFAYASDEVRDLGFHLLGRRLYEAMLYWKTEPPDQHLDAAEREFAERWKAMPKVVFSTTLTAVDGTNMRLATATLTEEIAQLRAQPGDGNIAIGGATLAAAAAAEDLIDEYRIRIYPVLVGGGTPFFPHDARRADLELVETRAFAHSVHYLRYRVTHPTDQP
jgi:dihydrofolate reductase